MMLSYVCTSVFGNLVENVCLKPENGFQLSLILRHAAEVGGVLPLT